MTVLVVKKKSSVAQATIDYLILMAVLVVVMVPLFYGTQGRLDSFRESVIVDATQAILAAADSIVNLGYGSATREVIHLPKGIHSYKMIGSILSVQFRDINITAQFRKDIIGRFPIAEGRHYINLFNNGTNILFYQCGNNLREAFEQCDGIDIRLCKSSAPSCTPPEFEDDACKCRCSTDLDCPGKYFCEDGICQPGATCGNGVVEGNEECDDDKI